MLLTTPFKQVMQLEPTGEDTFRLLIPEKDIVTDNFPAVDNGTGIGFLKHCEHNTLLS